MGGQHPELRVPVLAASAHPSRCPPTTTAYFSFILQMTHPSQARFFCAQKTVIKNSTARWQYCLLLERSVLVPVKSLAQNPERYRHGNKEQAKADWAAPAKP
jgi:hypothetical protein